MSPVRQLPNIPNSTMTRSLGYPNAPETLEWLRMGSVGKGKFFQFE